MPDYNPTLDSHIQRTRSAAPHLPARLTPAQEAKQLKQLTSWFRRIEEAREAYRQGELEKPEHAPGWARDRTTAYYAVEPTSEEAGALYALYAMLTPLIVDLSMEEYHNAKRIPEGGTRNDGTPHPQAGKLVELEVEDLMMDSIELFQLHMASYDPEQGVPVRAYTAQYYPREVRRHIWRHMRPRHAELDEEAHAGYASPEKSASLDEIAREVLPPEAYLIYRYLLYGDAAG